MSKITSRQGGSKRHCERGKSLTKGLQGMRLWNILKSSTSTALATGKSATITRRTWQELV